MGRVHMYLLDTYMLCHGFFKMNSASGQEPHHLDRNTPASCTIIVINNVLLLFVVRHPTPQTLAQVFKLFPI